MPGSSIDAVITKLNGGLGNQLFQYAAGRSLADRLNVPLKIDLSTFENYKLRGFELNKFNIEAEIAKPADTSGINLHPSKFNKYRSRLAINFGYTLSSYPFKEKYYRYDKLFAKITKPVYLEGYWQSEEYFRTSDAHLRREINFKHSFDDNSEQILKEISQHHAVSLHIRRGDYVTNPSAAAVHGVCSLEYYDAAIRLIATRISQPFFFVFSDDPQWAKENLKMNHPVHFVEANGPDRGVEDMWLMKSCNHHIIANSSFSWWAAWLNNKPDKIVVAPKIWFRDPTINTRDLIPKQWIRL
jgi:hypothetical protein